MTCQCDDPFKTLEELEVRAAEGADDPFVSTMHGGRMILALPVMYLDDYLAVPRWCRWLFYLGYALGVTIRDHLMEHGTVRMKG